MSAATVARLKITLDGVKPAVLRRVEKSSAPVFGNQGATAQRSLPVLPVRPVQPTPTHPSPSAHEFRLLLKIRCKLSVGGVE
jgi:hypothetical protein